MPSLTDLLIPTYKQNLKSLSAWLDKAGGGLKNENNDGDSIGMLTRRLAPDMFPLATQVRFVCFQAQEAVYRLQGKEIPQKLLDLAEEGRRLNDNDNDDDDDDDTVESAKGRIQEALAFLESLEPDALDQNEGNDERTITLELPDGMKFDMTAEQYVRDWALPQFYFHTVVAYSILRSAGVELGKADYVPHMYTYLRKPTAS